MSDAIRFEEALQFKQVGVVFVLKKKPFRQICKNVLNNNKCCMIIEGEGKGVLTESAINNYIHIKMHKDVITYNTYRNSVVMS